MKTKNEEKLKNSELKASKKFIDEKQVEEIKEKAKEKTEKIKVKLEEEADKQKKFTILGYRIWRILAYFVIYKFAGAFVDTQIGGIVLSIILSTVYINLGLGIFNLIPMPPLDGSKILKNFLPYRARAWMESNEYLFYMIFLALWIFGILGNIISPLINVVSDLLISGVGKLFGL